MLSPYSNHTVVDSPFGFTVPFSMAVLNETLAACPVVTMGGWPETGVGVGVTVEVGDADGVGVAVAVGVGVGVIKEVVKLHEYAEAMRNPARSVASVIVHV